ncbi:MAG: T9SS type B sorting domain-containing protein [Paludibacteraceae bacterium]|nr:T9SS type B sorting domain-containing protein [Paludibacteraceae bacterium]
MGKRKLLLIVATVLSLLTTGSVSWAQCPLPDFDEVIPFCTQENEYGITYSADTTSENVDFWGNKYIGCLGSTPSPAWFVMQIEEDGQMYILISHSEQQDIDFVCFGPFEGSSKTDMLKKVCESSEEYLQLETPISTGPLTLPEEGCTYSPEFTEINDSLEKYKNLRDQVIRDFNTMESLVSLGLITDEEYLDSVYTLNNLYFEYDSLLQPYKAMNPLYYDISSNCFRSKLDEFPNGHIVDCSYSENAKEICHIENAKAGEWYILLVTNYSQEPGTISFDKYGPSVQTNCDIIIDASVNDVCKDGDINFHVNNAPPSATFVWTGPNGFYSTDKNPIIQHADKDHEGTYSVQMCANGIYSPVVYLDVVVNPTYQTDTTVDIKDGEAFAIGDDILTDEGTYSYNLTSKTGCDSLVTLHLNVRKIDMSSNSPLCEGETLVLNAEENIPGATFSWITPNGDVLTGKNISIPNMTVNDGGQYTLTMDINGNVENAGHITVEVHSHLTTTKDTTLHGGETIVFGTQNINAAGTYTETFHRGNDCDSIVTLTVSDAKKNIYSNTPLCEGGTLTITVSDYYPENSLHWFGPNNFTQDGGLEVTITDVKPSGSGEYVVKSDVFMGTTGEMIEYFRIPVEIYNKYDIDTTVIIPAGLSYTFGSNQLTTEGTYTETFTSSNGCDSTVHLTLHVGTPEATISDNGPLCEGDTLIISLTSCNAPSNSLHWSGPNNFSQDGGLELTIKDVKANNAGEYIVKTDIFQGQTGELKEVARTSIIVHNKIEVDTTVTILTGLSYTFGNNQLTSAGTYTDTFPSAQGCDSIVHLTLLEETPEASISDNGPICEDEALSITVTTRHYPENSLHWSGPNNFTQEGGFGITIPGAKSSDAGEYIVKTDIFQGETGELKEIARTSVEVHNKIEVDTTVTILTGLSYTFGNNRLTSAGTYTETFPSAQGCDSTVHLTLLEETPEASISNNGPICEDEALSITITTRHYPENSLHWSGPNNFTQEGGFGITIPGAKASDAGEYIVKTDIFQGETGELKEIARTSVEVHNKIEVDTTVTILTGLSYTFGNNQLTSAGTYTETYLSAQGCDSIVRLTLLEETPEASISDNGPICEDEALSITVTTRHFPENSLHWFGPNNFTQEGGFGITIPGAKASDAGEYIVKTDMFQGETGELKEIARTNVEVYSKIGIDTTVTILTGESYTFGSNQLTAEGTYTETFTSTHGCDSTVHLTLQTEDINISISDNGPICEGEALTLSAQDVPNKVQVEWIGPNGIISNDPVVTIGNVSVRDSGTYQLVVSIVGKNIDTLSTHVEVYTKDKVTIFDSMSDDTYAFGDILIEKPGTYTISLKNEHGCDSIVTLQLSWAMDTFQIIPDAYFTPNGDGVRDYWHIENIEKRPSTVKIYDRYGRIVRLYEIYENETGWDGKDENGNDVPSSDYWYLINNSYQDNIFVGHVTVLR